MSNLGYHWWEAPLVALGMATFIAGLLAGVICVLWHIEIRWVP